MFRIKQDNTQDRIKQCNLDGQITMTTLVIESEAITNEKDNIFNDTIPCLDIRKSFFFCFTELKFLAQIKRIKNENTK